MTVCGVHYHTKMVRKKKYLTEYKNTRVGVDGQQWMYKASAGWCRALAEKKPTRAYVFKICTCPTNIYLQRTKACPNKYVHTSQIHQGDAC